MKKRKKVFVIVLACFFVLSLLSFFARFTKLTAQVHFNFDQKSLLLITEYLKDEPELTIHTFDKIINFYSGTDVTEVPLNKIENQAVKKAIQYLFNVRGYYYIERNDNSIIFTKRAWGDFRTGLVYLVDENADLESEVEYLTLSEPLSDSGWYYWESDYQKWKSIHLW